VPEWTSIFQESIEDTFHKKATNFVFAQGKLSFDVLNNDKYIKIQKKGRTILKHEKPIEASELVQFLIDFPLEDTVYQGVNNGWVFPKGGLSHLNMGSRCGRLIYTNVNVQ